MYRGCGLAHPYDWRGCVETKKKTKYLIPRCISPLYRALNGIFLFQASLWVSQGIAKAEPTIGLLLELISLGEFGGGDVVYNGTAVVHPNQRVKGYAVYPRYRPTARSRWKPIWAQVQRGVGGHRLNFLWNEDVNKGLKMVLFYIVFVFLYPWTCLLLDTTKNILIEVEKRKVLGIFLFEI